MSIYIDVNVFYEKMYEWVRMNGGIIRNEMQAILEAVPSIDIVRCKDCIYREKYPCNELEFYECNHLRLYGTKVGVNDDWFCADGKRKE